MEVAKRQRVLLGVRCERRYNIVRRGGAPHQDEDGRYGVRWIPDRRQQQRFGGRPEVVGGIELPVEFLFAERVRPRPSEEKRLGDRFGPIARAWRERREGGPTG